MRLNLPFAKAPPDADQLDERPLSREDAGQENATAAFALDTATPVAERHQLGAQDSGSWIRRSVLIRAFEGGWAAWGGRAMIPNANGSIMAAG